MMCSEAFLSWVGVLEEEDEVEDGEILDRQPLGAQLDVFLNAHDGSRRSAGKRLVPRIPKTRKRSVKSSKVTSNKPPHTVKDQVALRHAIIAPLPRVASLYSRKQQCVIQTREEIEQEQNEKQDRTSQQRRGNKHKFSGVRMKSRCQGRLCEQGSFVVAAVHDDDLEAPYLVLKKTICEYEKAKRHQNGADAEEVCLGSYRRRLESASVCATCYQEYSQFLSKQKKRRQPKRQSLAPAPVPFQRVKELLKKSRKRIPVHSCNEIERRGAEQRQELRSPLLQKAEQQTRCDARNKTPSLNPSALQQIQETGQPRKALSARKPCEAVVVKVDCFAYFADEGYSHDIADQVLRALQEHKHIKCCSELQSALASASESTKACGATIETCKLVLRSLYFDLKPFCADLGYFPSIETERDEAGSLTLFLMIEPTQDC